MEFVNHPLIKPDTVEARLYQQTLFASCSKENSLVILPTGLGKTIVFLMLAAHRLEKHPEGKVVLCAPTKPLLDQHERTIRELMNVDDDLVIQLSGKVDPRKRKEIWKEKQIIVCTPQTLQNDIIQRRIDLNNVVFLCLDEAHKSVGDHSYVFIAEQYNQKANNALILAITASPGANIEKIQEVQENLGIKNVQIRDESSEDVKQYIHEIKEEWERVKLPKEFKYIIDTLNGIFKQILEGLKELQIIRSANPRNNPRKTLLTLRTIVNQKYSNSAESNTRTEFFTAMGLVGNSLRVSHAIELIETQGIPSLSKYLEGQIGDLRRGKGSQTLRKLMMSEEMTGVVEAVKILQEQNVIHPKLSKLKKLVEEEVRKAPSNRILVFAHFRITAKAIADEINAIKGVNAHWFVGQSSVRDKGLSQKEQIEIMQAFREGEYNVLVSTSVAEEGLDIGECDLVIFYDAVPSAIRLIQRKGRTGRRKEGRVILLMAEGTRDEGYMWASRKQAKKMRTIVKELQDNQVKSERREKQKGIMEYLSTEKLEPVKTKIKKEKQEAKDVKESTKGEEITIILDSRERNSSIVKELIRKDVELGFERLEMGDYICSDQVIVERKEVSDLVSSIIDKRLFTQAKILAESCVKPIIIIEGDFSVFRSSLHPHALAGAVSSLAVDYRIPLIYTQNQKETAEMLYAIARREQVERKRRVSIGKKKGVGLKVQLEESVASLPHVDYKLATRLLKHFGSLREVVTAKLEEYMEIKGVGDKIATDIIEFVYANYNEIEKGEDISETLDDLEWLKKESKNKS